ncbi:Alginate lyase [Pseudarcicella hirudinis]|uniref:Alginate lyase n=1 Tax=Pseudarcicella hirudinis TaxID=1079859 RepID=A0A1I5P9J9_9BACT|nr:alginate lyase family protein [Pseudarcicella hirudinis]SFP30617.1 Alginate lyase [Pseudarcicella hirudinis]
MKVYLFFLLIVCNGISGVCQKAPETLLINSQDLWSKKQRIYVGDTSLLPAYRKMILEADRIVKAGEVYSVINKIPVPPSGDKHDYMSQAPYWWPDPNKPDGKPYIRKDGERNPEIKGITDHDQLDKLIHDTEILALSYFFTGKESYARQASKLLTIWFFDEKTRMNPNLNFGQGIPGINNGRGIGIIETRNLVKICDAAILISPSQHWSQTAQEKLRNWFSAYTDWLLNSEIGKDEADEHNNHGTFYNVQVMAYALFTGNTSLAKNQIDSAKSRLQSQLKTDGSQPFELARTLPYDYASMNLEGFFQLAAMSQKLNTDLWNYQTEDGKSIRKAIDWFVPFLSGKQVWPYKQLKSPTQDHMDVLLKMASEAYQSSDFAAYGWKISPEAFSEDLSQLKY